MIDDGGGDDDYDDGGKGKGRGEGLGWNVDFLCMCVWARSFGYESWSERCLGFLDIAWRASVDRCRGDIFCLEYMERLMNVHASGLRYAFIGVRTECRERPGPDLQLRRKIRTASARRDYNYNNTNCVLANSRFKMKKKFISR